jgi:hypothetical protein
MPEQKLLPPPRYHFGEPWRLGRGLVLLSDSPGVFNSDPQDRIYYGGNLVAESITRERAGRAMECVNFCAGFWFPPHAAYPGGLTDLVDLLEQLHRRVWDEDGEPRGRYVGIVDPAARHRAREEFDLWNRSYQTLRNLGRPQ